MHRSASSNNLFENADFELPMTKPSGHHHWNCYGEVIHGHAGNMSRSSQYKHHGNHSGLCTHRVSFHAGPGQFVGEYFYTNIFDILKFEFCMNFANGDGIVHRSEAFRRMKSLVGN